MKRWLCCTCLLPMAVLAFQPQADQLPNIDRRLARGAASAKTNTAVRGKSGAEAHGPGTEATLRARIPTVQVDFHELTRSPRWVSAPGAFLTGEKGRGQGVAAQAKSFGDDAPAVVKTFVEEHAQLFGHGAAALDDAQQTRDFTTPHSGLRTITWAQQINGVSVYEALLTAHVTARGELVNISSQFIPETTRSAAAKVPAVTQITAAQAITIAATNIGEALNADPVQTAAPAGSTQEQRFRAAPLPGEATAQQIWVPLSPDDLRLCWQVTLSRRARGEMFLVLIDAQTGEMYVRRSLTVYLTPASYRVYTSDSPTPFSPGYSTPQTNQPPQASRVLVSTSALDTNASPAGWISDTGNETLGNNVDTHLDTNGDNNPDLPRPQGSPARTFDFTMSLAQPPSSYGDASVVQLFYWNNWMHDRLYQLGFTEAAGNFQVDNFGRGGVSGDPVQADSQDGSGYNNANISVPSDGYSPRMQMFVFTGPEPDRDSSFDAEVVLHEYTHGLSIRRVGGGGGMYNSQSAGMGEGWSDFYGLGLLSGPTDDLGGNYAAGAYASYQLYGLAENYYFGIRRYPYSTNLATSPLTFKDIDPAQASAHTGVPISPVFGSSYPSEVHAQGEVWCVTLWEVRAQLIAKYGFTNGNERVLRLVTDAMNLCPPNPTFIESRDAILQADLVSGGADRIQLWTAFAKRGMGASAAAPPSSTTTGVREAFDLPEGLDVLGRTPVFFIGNTGGPFTPTSTNYTLANNTSSNIQWAIGTSANWLNITPSSGTITPAQVVNVTASPNAAASALSPGFYTNFVSITNRSSGSVRRMTVVLRTGPQNYYTELFTSGIDLQGNTFTLKPDASSSFYALCRFPEPDFHTDPAAGQYLYLGDDGYAPITLTDSATVLFYGRRTNTFFISANGYITFDQPDTRYTATLSNHFSLPRISGLFADWHPGVAGSVRWQQLSDRVAITWWGVPLVGGGGSNSFQIEMFFADGVIRLTYPHIEASAGLAGLSMGQGIPPDFAQTDFSAAGCGSATVDHFAWYPIGSPQSANSPFNVGIIARDVFNFDQPNFTGPVRITAQQPGVTVFSADFSGGLSGFVISNNVRATAGLWHLTTARALQAGHSASNSLYYGRGESAGGGGGNYDAGLTAGFVTSPSIDLRTVSAPITLSFNELVQTENNPSYDRCSLEVSADDGAFFTTVASTFGVGQPLPTSSSSAWINTAVDLSNFAGQQILLRFRFDTIDSVANQFEGWFIDDILITGTAGALASSPTNSGTFSSATWFGNVTIQQPAPQAILLATDSNNHRGVSAPFTVNAANDVALYFSSSVSSAVLGENVTFVAAVTNSGPSSATSVYVTNQLPSAGYIASVSGSGTSSLSGNRVTTSLGTLGAGGGAVVSIVFVPTNTGGFTATSTVRRAEADAFAGNNTRTASFGVGMPAVTIIGTSVSENNSFASFSLLLNPTSAIPVSVRFTTVSSNAAAGTDFIATNGFVRFEPGEQVKTLNVSIVNDSVFETNELFAVLLTSVTNALLTATNAGCVIYDDDPLPVVAISSPSILEGDTGTNQMPFQFSVYGATAVPMDISYSVSPYDATAGIDFVPVSGILHFNPGETNKTVFVPIIGDRLNEPDERLLLYAYGVSSVSVTNNGLGTIVDDDLPVIVLTNYTIVSESCFPNNGSIDPGETVTAQLTLQNIGYHGLTSTGFTATLLATNGITNPSGPQTYGVTTNGGPAVSRPFTFVPAGGCGSNVVLTLQLRDGTTNLGLAALSLRLGRHVATWSESFDSIATPGLPPEWGSYSPLGYLSWATSSGFYDSSPNAAFVSDPYNSSITMLFSPSFTVQGSDAQLQFRHWFSTESCCDYGRLALLPSEGTGGEWTELGGSFERGGYTPYYYSTNGWRGYSGGFVTTVANFPTNYMGKTVRVVWEFHSDWSVSGIGWAIDNVSLLDGYACCDSSLVYIQSVQRTGGNIVLRWSSQSNKTYRVEYSPGMQTNANWNSLAGDVTASGLVASKTNTLPVGAVGFYRVRQLP